MRLSNPGYFAALGVLAAFSLCGSTWRSPKIQPASTAETAFHAEGRHLYSAGEYTRARQAFRSAALLAERDGSPRRAAMNWNDAGAAALASQNFRDALPDFLKARQIAGKFNLRQLLLITMNNLAGLYLQMNDPEAAMRVAREALARTNEHDDEIAPSRLRFQLATALARLHRFDEAEPIYRQAIGEIATQNDLDTTARVLGNFGSDCLEAGRLEEAEDALSEALRLVRLHHLNASANILRALAQLRRRQGDPRSASALFEAALQSPPNLTPQWEIYADRGEFRLGMNDLPGAVADFRQARRIASQMRADIVPADQDRIALEGGLSRVAEGLVDAGNRLAQKTSDRKLLRETFDEAEQDRLWSLRALVPTPNDWRTRLPGAYWDLLARYQSIERTLLAKPSAELGKQAAALRMQLQQIEAAAASASHSRLVDANLADRESAMAHAGRVLDADSALFSFHVTKSSGWLWALDRRGVDVYPIPRLDTLKGVVADFALAARNGDTQAVVLGNSLYQVLFGGVSARYLSHRRWLLELDGPLFDLPFAALVPDPGKGKNEPIYLFERTVLQTIPGALMLETRTSFGNGSFLGVGDPIYNAADARYHGDRTKQEVALPRLPATGAEVEACSRAWNPARAQILTGADASLARVRTALHARPSVIHFATHVVTGPDNYSSGLIALSLDRSGAMGLMGPAEIVADTVSPSLVVLNGCHSDQGQALPASGLMGLTRAWIGAGARSVLATQWDIPDEAGSEILIDFYRALRAYPESGPAFALQQAQIKFYKHSSFKRRGSSGTPAIWGAYFVLGRE